MKHTNHAVNSEASTNSQSAESLSIFSGSSPPDCFQAFHHLIINDEDIKSIEDAEFIWKKLIVRGQCTVIAARANGGKTTVVMQACADMAADGFKVIYFDLDSGASGIKNHRIFAKANGYQIAAPDIKAGAGLGNAEVLRGLNHFAYSGADLPNTVIVIDTLKKMYEILSKGAARKFFELTRKLTASGATILLLAHNNKHTDANGKQVFEGTGDVRNDVDCLIYFETTKDSSGVVCGTTDIDKNRFEGMQNISFKIYPNRLLEFVNELIDIKSTSQVNELLVNNQLLVDAIQDALYKKTMSARDLFDCIKVLGQGWSRNQVKNTAELLCRSDINKLRKVIKTPGVVYALSEKLPQPN